MILKVWCTFSVYCKIKVTELKLLFKVYIYLLIESTYIYIYIYIYIIKLFAHYHIYMLAIAGQRAGPNLSKPMGILGVT